MSSRRFYALFLTFPGTLSVLVCGIGSAVASFAFDSSVARFGWHHGYTVEAPWQFITAHFVHLNAAHFGLNFIAAVLFGMVCDRLALSPQLLLACAVSMVCVCLGLEFGPWHIDWYVGFSGVLHGMFAWLCLRLALSPAQEHWWGLRGAVVAVFFGGLVKVTASLSIPVGSLGWQGIPQATPAHLYGFAGGVFWALLRRPK